MSSNITKHQAANHAFLDQSAEQIMFWSTVVRNSRVVLLGAIFTTIIIVLQTGIGRLPDPVSVSDGTASDTIQIKTPKIISTMTDGRSFTVEAEQAAVIDQNDGAFILTNLRAFTDLQNNEGLHVFAGEGLLSHTNEHLWLKGKVRAKHTNGTVIETEVVEVWQAPDGVRVKSDTVTRITSSTKYAEAAGFSAKDHWESVVLTGPISIKGTQN